MTTRTPPDAAPAAIAGLASISIDCPDPRALAPFYRSLLGLTKAFAAPDGSVIALAGAGPMITLMRVDDYVAPQWPGGPQRQQMHLDLAAEDLDTGSRAVVAIGGSEASTQPDPGRWRVMLDPVGHPFCLSAVRPE
ncbi:VOC family protein [Brachybacterium subflavum]|uniref:VOC family protein n=1 Tax=Brachybacterium subflavum TaxID=2585206 RepID=UPI00126632DC|nr:VOC family protein [Brachybacterium subflavum]